MIGLTGIFSSISTRIRHSCVQNIQKLAYPFRVVSELGGIFINKRLPSAKCVDTPWEIGVSELIATDRKIHLMKVPSDASSNNWMMQTNLAADMA